MVNVQKEHQLQRMLAILRLQIKDRRRRLFVWLGGTFGDFFLGVACMPARPGHLSFVETFGVFPITLFLIFGTAAIIAGWRLGEAEDRARAVEVEIQDLYEYG